MLTWVYSYTGCTYHTQCEDTTITQAHVNTTVTGTEWSLSSTPELHQQAPLHKPGGNGDINGAACCAPHLDNQVLERLPRRTNSNGITARATVAVNILHELAAKRNASPVGSGSKRLPHGNVVKIRCHQPPTKVFDR
eukprot:m.375063 g.375063  ORF g.375063 m.375063 type:complete len:137 (-) comp20913_c0_seq1:1055-1465(-)